MESIYEVRPRAEWARVYNWGKELGTASKIVFTNGELDPWGAGGVRENISETVVSIWIKGAAHHMDLRGPNKLDPESVRKAREYEREVIRKWLRE